MKLAKALQISPDALRVRSFAFNGQPLRVRVPLASEMEQMNQRVQAASWQAKYDELTAPIMARRDEVTDEAIEFLEDDVRIAGKSVKDTAKLAAQTNARIVEMFKLLVPLVEGEDLATLTYEDIEAEFPLSIQLELSKKIAEVISPGYEETRKN